MAGTVDGNGMRLGTSLCLLAAGQLLASFGIQWYTIARLGVGSDTDALYAGSTLLQLCSAVVLDQVSFVLVPLLAHQRRPEVRSTATPQGLATVAPVVARAPPPLPSVRA